MDGDGICQQLQLLFVKFLTGLIGVGFNFIDGEQLIGALFREIFRKISQQCAKALAKSFVGCL